MTMPSAYAQKPAPEYQVKAVFLYNFTRFIDWPADAFTSSTAPFVIGIIGDDPFGTFMEETVAGEQMNGHPIIIQRYHNSTDAINCHILFINSNDQDRIKEILAAIKGKNILTVNDANNFVKWGGVVRFYNEDNKVRLQINITAAKAAQLDISSKLLNVADIY